MQDRFARYGEMKDEITAIRASSTSADRAVTVIAGPAGSVLDIKLTEQALSTSASALGSSVLSAIRLAVADAARQQAAIVQRYVGDRPVAQRVMATQQELLGDKITAGEQEAERLRREQGLDADESLLPQDDRPEPEQPRFQPPARPQFAPQPPQPQFRPPAPQRRAPARDDGDGDGFEAMSGGDGW